MNAVNIMNVWIIRHWFNISRVHVLPIWCLSLLIWGIHITSMSELSKDGVDMFMTLRCQKRFDDFFSYMMLSTFFLSFYSFHFLIRFISITYKKKEEEENWRRCGWNPKVGMRWNNRIVYSWIIIEKLIHSNTKSSCWKLNGGVDKLLGWDFEEGRIHISLLKE